MLFLQNLLLLASMMLQQCTFIALQTHSPKPSTRQFHLADDTPAKHLIGNIWNRSSPDKRKLSRAMLSPDDYFHLTLKGNLLTSQAIDRDSICERLECCNQEICQMTLNAFLFESQLSPLVVKIVLLISDHNDNPPVFPRQSSNPASNDTTIWKIRIPETSPLGSRHSLPAARDSDSPRYGIKSYRLIADNWNGNYLFTSQDNLPFSLVVPTSSDRLPGPPQLQVDGHLDRETNPKYSFRLVAIDGGSPPKQATLNVIVEVTDVNDNAPKFVNITNSSDQSINLDLSESTSIGSVVRQFTAIDSDQGENARIVYVIDWLASYPQINESARHAISSKYSIDKHKGYFKVVGELDFESELERKLRIVIVAHDHGSPRLSASLTLSINLLDSNDNDPQITVVNPSDGEVDVDDNKHVLEENDSTPRLVQLISVSDPDSVSEGKVSCRLGSGSTSDFVLDAYSSTMYGLTNRRAFDFEKLESSGSIPVLIQCEDSASPIRSSQRWLNIPIKDVNDNWPQFKQTNYRFFVSEDKLSGSIVGQVEASDADSGPRGQLTYELVADEDEWLKLLRIDSMTGHLIVNSKLDREKHTRLDFHVTARDGGDGSSDDNFADSTKTNTTLLTVLITDVNDNAPVYIGPNKLYIPENAPIGTPLLDKVIFKDIDSGSNGTVSIKLLPTKTSDLNGNQTYQIDYPLVRITHTMRLVSNVELDRESQSSFTIHLAAQDNGIPFRLSSTTTVTIEVLDVNDNPPRLIYPKNGSLLLGLNDRYEWMRSSVATSVPADTPFNTLLITLRAEDPDDGENGTVTFNILPGPVSRIYHLTEITKHDSRAPDQRLDCRDGFNYFQLDTFEGHLKTKWGQPPIESTNSSEKNVMNNSLTSHSISQPEPGLYVIHVELTDKGLSPRKIRAYFFVNVSQPTGNGHYLTSMLQNNFSNTIILVLICVCSLALILSLVGAILWVRSHSSSSLRATTSNRQGSLDLQQSNGNGNPYWHSYHHNSPYHPETIGHVYYSQYPRTLVSPSELSELSQALMLPPDGSIKRDDWYDESSTLNQYDNTKLQSPLYNGNVATTFSTGPRPPTSPPKYFTHDARYQQWMTIPTISSDGNFYQQHPDAANFTITTFPSVDVNGDIQDASNGVNDGLVTFPGPTNHQANSVGESDSGVDSGSNGIIQQSTMPVSIRCCSSPTNIHFYNSGDQVAAGDPRLPIDSSHHLHPEISDGTLSNLQWHRNDSRQQWTMDRHSSSPTD